jgi:nucleoside-diphosphate-sugar epimerase
MRLFVTGGTGFIGSHFLQAALAAGHEVTALRRPGSAPGLPLAVAPTWADGDLENLDASRLRGMDALVHLAAVGTTPNRAEWGECFRCNVGASVALWKQASDAGIRNFVIAGSCFEYGRSAERYEFIPVRAPLEPTGPYAASKAAATMAAWGLAVERGLSLAILRPFHVFGDGGEEGFWPALRAAASAGGDFSMTAGEQVRDFVPAAQVAAEFLAALEHAPVAGQPTVRNVGTGRPQTLRSFAEEWWRKLGAAGQLRLGAVPYRANEIMRCVPQL